MSLGASEGRKGPGIAQTAWLVQRVALAIVLIVGFYSLALATIGGLLWIPYAELTYLHRVDIRLAIFCIGGAIGLFLSLVPRRDHFTPPGPLLDDASEPRLFSFVRSVAAETGQVMPSEIYIVREMNAWVAKRGGTMGFGGRRVMGIGLPLLQAMPLPEVTSVVAHEFGHFASSDVALSSWTYNTRSAIVRTVAGLQDSLLGRPFVWYAHMFMRLTAAVSRRQEFVADQMSARLVGSEVAARALRRIATMAPAYAVYVQTQVRPILQSGFLPPIHDGFERFLRTGTYGRLSTQVLEASESVPAADAADTHPPLRERLAALGANGEMAAPALAPASSLLNAPDEYSRLLMIDAFGATAVDSLKPIAWERVGDTVLAAQWRRFVAAHLHWLAPITVDAMPLGREALLTFAKPMRIDGGFEPVKRVAFASSLLGAALAVRLMDEGWLPESLPGEPIRLWKDGASFEPFTTTNGLAKGTAGAKEWTAECQRMALSGPLLPLAMAAGMPGIATREVETAAVKAAEDTAARRRRRSW